MVEPRRLDTEKRLKIEILRGFSRLNDLVNLDQFELPKIEELVSLLKDQKYFTVLDLKDGFYHVPIRKEDREKTAFFSGRRLMQFVMMPQGYKNSSAIFQRAMSLIFKDILGTKCLVYIDDILIFAKTVEEHDKNLNEVLKIMDSYSLVENEAKRIYCKENISFLGYDIAFNKIKPTVERSEGIKGYERPKNKKALQRFLGLVNYDRKFIKNITELLHPFYELLEKGKAFIWEIRQYNAFIKVKEIFGKELVLKIPDFSKEFTLESDASNVGLGAVLLQEDCPIVYISRSLNNAEKRYSITEKELLSALWAMERLKYYLLGRRFRLLTDHKAIEELKHKTEFGSNRIHRWFERSERFDFYVEYKQGTKMILADALSRAPRLEIENIELINDKIMKIHKDNNHRKNIEEILQQNGINISRKYLKDILDKCLTCNMKNDIGAKTCSFIKALKPGERFAIDILEIAKQDLIIVGIDYFSRKLFGNAEKHKNAVNVVNFLYEVYAELPFNELVSDNGKEFDNDVIKA